MSESKDMYYFFIEQMNKTLDQSNFDLNMELEKLFEIERRFTKKLASSKAGLDVYQKFINYIMHDQCNILLAKVYFRERETVFLKQIPNLFRNNKFEKMSKFNLNYKFLHWSMQHVGELKSAKKFKEMFDEVVFIRKRIVEQMLPLVVNRSRLFQVKTRKFNDDVLEFIQTSTEGLLSAIDKYVPPNKTENKFRGVAVGWMQAKLMSDHSEGMVKLTVNEKRVLYRANIARYRHGMTDMNDVLSFVRESFPAVTMEGLKPIISTSGEFQSLSIPSGKIKDQVSGPEQGIIDRDEVVKLRAIIDTLPILNRKVLRLKGGF